MGLIISGIVAVVIIVLAILLGNSYVKAPPDTVFVISGGKRRMVTGRATLKIPFFERLDRITLKLIPIDVKTSNTVPTADYINVRVDSVVNIKVSNTPENLEKAAQNFLNQPPERIAAVAREVLEGNTREIVGQMKLQEIVTDRQKFAEMVKTNAEPDLASMGLEIVSFNVQNIVDDNQVIENLGIDNVEQIRKNALIAKANAQKEIEIAQAHARKEANDVKVTSDTEIAFRQNELEVKKAELKAISDKQKAKADAAKDIQAEEERKIREVATANANLARLEKETELKEREVKITERMLEAQVKKKAEAEKYAAQMRAEADLYARQKKAEAERFETEKQVEADMRIAEAEKFKIEQDALAKKAMAAAIEAEGKAEAEAARAKGEAEAEAIKAKALAEAEGLLKKAEAMKQYGEAALEDMRMQLAKEYVKQLPAIAQAIGEGYQGVDKIVMLGEDSGKLAGNIIGTTTQVSEGLSESLGIDLKSLLNGFLGGKLAASTEPNSAE
jgi:flotillin